MLTIDNVLKLAELGFTKEEIMQFNGESPAALAGETKTAEQEKKEAAPAPAAPLPVPEQKKDVNAELISAIQDLKKTIQASNIASTPQPVQQNAQEKAEEVLLKMANM